MQPPGAMQPISSMQKGGLGAPSGPRRARNHLSAVGRSQQALRRWPGHVPGIAQLGGCSAAAERASGWLKAQRVVGGRAAGSRAACSLMARPVSGSGKGSLARLCAAGPDIPGLRHACLPAAACGPLRRRTAASSPPTPRRRRRPLRPPPSLPSSTQQVRPAGCVCAALLLLLPLVCAAVQRGRAAACSMPS